MEKRKIKIITLLKAKQDTCTRLLQKLEEQMKAVNDQEDLLLSAIVEEKEGFISDLNEIDQKITGLASDLNEVARESLINENQGLADRIETALEKIIQQEKFCQEKLNLVRNEVVEKIINLKKGKKLLMSYGVTPRIKLKISKKI